jgi:SAM-dependent methyltransferase
VTTAAQESRSATIVAFDRLAADYDTLAGGEIFRVLRARTHREFARCFTQHSRVLEIGCGTGVDTRFLATSCRYVVACDPSEEMVSRTLRRLTHDGLDTRVTVMPCGLQDVQSYLEALAPHEPFDGIISNFGALNCVPDLAPLGALTRRHLRPGGVVLLGVMTRVCVMEVLYFALTGRLHLAGRRRGGGAVAVQVAGVSVPTYYHRVGDVRRALGSDLRRAGTQGLGVIIPPPYLEPRWRALPPRVRAAIAGVDSLLASRPPFNRVGDHVLLRFVKEPAHD